MTKRLQPFILIVEDEDAVASLIKYNLRKIGYNFVHTTEGNNVMDMIHEHKPDLILLDVVLPDISGIDLCRTIRLHPVVGNTPIIIISARDKDTDKIVGLETGADDYITKPFSADEMIARIATVLRRLRPAFSRKTLEYDDIYIDLQKHTIRRGNTYLQLSPFEFKILQLLMDPAEVVRARDEIVRKIWGRNIKVGVRTVDVHITRIRKKMAQAMTPESKAEIITVRPSGYKLASISEGTTYKKNKA